MAEAVVLKPGREKPVRQQHPWVFSGGIRSLPQAAADGAIVDVRAHDGQWLAAGYLNRQSQIQIRLLSWEQSTPIDDHFWEKRLAQALARRAHLAADPAVTAYRLINGENDYLPGLVVDRYDRWLVLQAGTLGIDLRKRQLAGHLLALTGCVGVIERSDHSQRQEEGLLPVSGHLLGEPPPDRVTIRENGYSFLVDLTGGQKTGYYTDQRSNRQRVAAWAAGAKVLNCFSYTGSFAAYALAAGAKDVTNLDASVEALELGEENLRLNGFDVEAQSESIAGDVFQILRDWQRQGRQEYDLIVLDPPKFAQNKRGLEGALRGYKEINLRALGLLRPGGILATFSCSGLVSADLFQKVVFGAAIDAGRPVQILEWLQQGADHPVALTFPEGAYLKGLICRVDER
ncbi:MAG: class I SAM-dependent rRNA methyltransferase [Caldilineaceae bacterium]|nr:class I SAM-dependent rRNA methyltransferase [Caldilineaceae bacterium]HRJ44091.1 class I SAM-dependent rRNA methyltransferase [Caldilineaceae bacterium]